jgi:hypothetical protein
VPGIMERDKRDSTVLVGSLLEPSNMTSLGIGKVVDLGVIVIGRVSSG